MENTPLTRHAFKKKLGDKLFLRLLEEYPEDLNQQCLNLGCTIEDLKPRSPSGFKEKGIPTDSKNIRQMHSEERRLAKLIKAAGELASDIESKIYLVTSSMGELFKGLNISYSTTKKSSVYSYVIQEPSSIFHKPSDVIQYNIERAKQKFHKSVEIIKRIEGLKAEEKKKTENMIKKSQEREKKLIEELSKREEEHEKLSSTLNEQRHKILQKKKEIEYNLDKQFYHYGLKLDKRMEKLSEINQKKVKDMMNKQHEKMKKKIQDCSKNSDNESQIKAQENEISKLMQELQEKIEKRILSYEDIVKQKIFNARANNIKVERIFSQSLTDYNKRTEESLKKVIHKSIVSEEKRVKKQERFKKNANELRNSARLSFMRNSKGIESLNEQEMKRVQQIEKRVYEKSKIFNTIKSKFEDAIKQKKQKNTDRFEGHNIKYSKALESQARLRSKVLDKHMRINFLAEDLKNQKFRIANSKRYDNFQISKIRTSATSQLNKRYASRSKFETTM